MFFFSLNTEWFETPGGEGGNEITAHCLAPAGFLGNGEEVLSLIGFLIQCAMRRARARGNLSGGNCGTREGMHAPTNGNVVW